MARNRCGYCGGLGHNRRGCPQLTSDLKASYETAKRSTEEVAKKYGEGSAKHISALRTLEHYTRRVSERTGRNPHTNMPTNKKKRTVSCSYCKYQGEYERAKGHTRRSCKHLKEATAKWHAANVDYRRHIVKQLNETGVTPGALIVGNEHVRGPNGWQMKEVIFMVTSIDSDNVSATHPDAGAIKAVPVGSHNIGGGNRPFAVPRLKNGEDSCYGIDSATGEVTSYYADQRNRPLGHPRHVAPIGSWFPTEDKEKVRSWKELLVIARGSEFSPPEDWYTKESPLVKQWLG